MGARARSRRTGKSPDLLSMVEAAYSVDALTRDRTSGLCRPPSDRVHLGAGLGGFACSFRGKADGTISVDRTSTAVAGQTPETMNAIFDGLTCAPPGWLSSYTASPRSASYCVMTSEVDPSVRLSYRTRLAKKGVHDGINIACMDLDRSGVLISLGVGRDDQLTTAGPAEPGESGDPHRGRLALAGTGARGSCGRARPGLAALDRRSIRAQRRARDLVAGGEASARRWRGQVGGRQAGFAGGGARHRARPDVLA